MRRRPSVSHAVNEPAYGPHRVASGPPRYSGPHGPVTPVTGTRGPLERGSATGRPAAPGNRPLCALLRRCVGSPVSEHPPVESAPLRGTEGPQTKGRSRPARRSAPGAPDRPLCGPPVRRPVRYGRARAIPARPAVGVPIGTNGAGLARTAPAGRSLGGNREAGTLWRPFFPLDLTSRRVPSALYRLNRLRRDPWRRPLSACLPPGARLPSASRPLGAPRQHL